jgi:hypothetical protein
MPSFLSPALLRSLLDYDKLTGEFTWRFCPTRGAQWNGCWPGKVAGTTMRDGYVRIGINGRPYAAHRLAWLWSFGEWPEDQIDHRNGIRNDNRLRNLRLATQEQNNFNIGRAGNNSSRFKGVCYDKKTGKWQSQIRAGGKRKYLGQFPSPEIAHAAYRNAAMQLHGSFARTA